MTPFTFEPAQPKDADQLAQFVNRAYRGEGSKVGWTTEADLLGGQRTDAEDLKSKINPPDELILLLKKDGELYGSVYLKKASKHLAYIGMLAVNPDIQAKGIGREILERSELWVSKVWNIHEMEMTVIEQRVELISYYERRGYQRTGDVCPFPMEDERFGLPKVPFLQMVVLRKKWSASSS
jgi:predicted N-acetyltransferase YhbS